MTPRKLFPPVTCKILQFCFLLFLSAGLTTFVAGCSGGSGSSGGGTTPPVLAAPAVTGVSPTSSTVGTAFTITVTGSNFQAQAVVRWNGTALVTTFVSASSLTAAVPASLTTTGVVAIITVSNPDGQASPSSLSTQLTIQNPLPTLTAVSPATLYAGADTTFMLTGTNFTSASVAMIGSTALSTTFVSGTSLTAVAPAALLATPGTSSLSVANPQPGGGSSQSVSIKLLQPPAKLASLSPSAVPAGSPATTVTLTGSYFTPTSVVYAGGGSFGTVLAATTYVSPTSLQFVVPAASLAYTGSLSVYVRDPASSNLTSNFLSLSVTNPVPVLTGISPVTITAGSPNFQLTLTGSNFMTTSSVLINGTAVQTNYNFSSTSVTVNVPASAVSTTGDVTVAVSNPAPGGGVSAAQTLHVISANNRVRTVNVSAADMGWDAAHGLLIASTFSTSATNPNSIVAIDPLQGTVKTAQALPGQPSGISVTSDGSYVYVTLPSTGQVERLTLPSLTPDITFSLGTNSQGAMLTSTSVAAAPGQPHTVAIARSTSSNILAQGVDANEVVIFDDGVPRATTAVAGSYNTYQTLTWGADATMLYGTDTATSTADEYTFGVSPAGVSLSSDRQGAIGEFVKHLAFDSKTGNLIDGYGYVINAALGQSRGQMQVQNTITYEANPFAIDTTQRKAFYLNVNGFYTSGTPTGTYIETFDLDRFNYQNSLLVEGLSGGISIVRWGTSGLAINGQQIYLIDGSFVSPSGVSSAVGGYAASSATLNSISPVAVAAGSADTQVTLAGKDFTQSSTVTWNNQNLLIDSMTDTQMVVTIPAAALSTAVASGLSVSNGPGTGNSNAIAFSVLPNLGTTAQLGVLDVSANELAWDSSRDLLYASVPASDPILPSSIAVIDPTKLAVQQTVLIANQPSVIALTGDNQYLYVGTFTQPSIQRYLLPSFTTDLTIPTGFGYAANIVGTRGSCTFPVEIQPLPGSPQTIAVSQGNGQLEPRSCGGSAIYDGAIPRVNTVTDTFYNSYSFAWGADASTLYGQSDQIFQPQSIQSYAAATGGISLQNVFNRAGYGARIHFDAGTGLLYSDSGIITDPVTRLQVGAFSPGILTLPDSTLKRGFVLSSTANSSPGSSGLGTNSYTLTVYDLNTLKPLNTIVIPDVLGYPNAMVRWGTNGIAIGTVGQVGTSGSVGAVYVLTGSAINGVQ